MSAIKTQTLLVSGKILACNVINRGPRKLGFNRRTISQGPDITKTPQEIRLISSRRASLLIWPTFDGSNFDEGPCFQIFYSLRQQWSGPEISPSEF